ncbi:hypothetical protein PCK1_002546 [Pneumocystis canis]|nr:hypothetical protein PCK1_002546 [Pneumocystis canis]
MVEKQLKLTKKLSHVCLQQIIKENSQELPFLELSNIHLSKNEDTDTISPIKSSFRETLDAVTIEDNDGCKMLNQYLIKQQIGRGSFGTVNRCIDTLTGKEYAIKNFSKVQLRKSHEIPRFHQFNLLSDSFMSNDGPFYRYSNNHTMQSDNPLSFIRKEITIMKKINHKNIVSMIEVLDDPHEDSLYMVLEMCEKGVVMDMGLNKVVKPYTETECRKWFRDLILGIEYLHAHGICHCDIKPENLLLSKDGLLKIADFGISKIFTKDNDAIYKIKGTPAFMAPELCSFEHVVSCKAADIWSMGVTLWCLVFGCLPFKESDITKLYNIIKTQKAMVPDYASLQLKDLFEKILEKDPEKRIKMHDLRQHDWVTLNGQDPMLSYEENTMGVIEEITNNDLDTAICMIKKAVNKATG